MKSIFRKLHLWLSLPFGVIITLICFSGAMLVFEYEVTRCVKPEVFQEERIDKPAASATGEVQKPRRKVVPRDKRLPFFRAGKELKEFINQ